MKRALLTLALLATVLFAVPILIIRAQPYDDSELRAFLTPPDCPAPCLMGIPINGTTATEAAKILQNNEWVDTVDTTNVNLHTGHGTLYWTWSGKQPEFIRSDVPGSYYSAIVAFHTAEEGCSEDQIMGSMIIRTKLPYGRVYLVMGGGSDHPKWPRSAPLYRNSDIVTFYPDQSLVVAAGLTCPVTPAKYWDAPVSFNVGFAINAGGRQLCPAR
jgi:hypothetical protein